MYKAMIVLIFNLSIAEIKVILPILYNIEWSVLL